MLGGAPSYRHVTRTAKCLADQETQEGEISFTFYYFKMFLRTFQITLASGDHPGLVADHPGTEEAQCQFVTPEVTPSDLHTAAEREGETYGGPEAWRGGAVFAGLRGAVPHHLAVDGAADAVVQLDVELGQHVG